MSIKQLILISTVLVTFHSCGHKKKYEMITMESNEIPVDVTKYIESGEFLPDSCEGRIDRLIKVKPLILDRSYENVLLSKIDKWKNEYNKWLKNNKRDTIDFKLSDLYKKTIYQYSYFINSDPIDVYKTKTDIEINGNKDFCFFIRLDQNGKIFHDYKEDGWVLNSCDSINSNIPDIYGEKK